MNNQGTPLTPKLELKTATMEKIMFFGIALWLALMMTDAPQVIRNDQKPKPAVTTINVKQEGVTQQIPPKPIKPHEHVIFYHSPE